MDAESLLNGALLGRLIAVLSLVVGLILLLTWFLRRSGLGKSWHRNGNRDKRLKILEIRPIDNQHRLVLIERDSTEHLLLIGNNSDLVIETNIHREKTGADALSDDPLERVRFRDVLPKTAIDKDTRILRPGERITTPEDDA